MENGNPTKKKCIKRKYWRYRESRAVKIPGNQHYIITIIIIIIIIHLQYTIKFLKKQMLFWIVKYIGFQSCYRKVQNVTYIKQ